MYVIKRVGDNYYVAKEGREHSYTNKIKHARKFPTRGAAEADRCPENEYIVPLADEID